MTSGPTIYVHVGLPKTGTTFLQDLLRQHSRALAQEGLLYPLVGGPDHFLPALDARGELTFAGVRRPHAEGTWAALVARAASASDRSVISHELLATADEAHVIDAMRLLEPYDAHIVVTARDPARQVVADWQESVKHGRSQGFDMYVKRGGVGEGEEGKPGSNTFRAQRLPDVLQRWGATLPADRVHVVTVPPPGSDPQLLWERFAGLLGVSDPGRFRPGTSVRRNERLGVTEIELMRRVNAVLRQAGDPAVRTIAKDVYAQNVLARVSSSPPPVLPVELRPRLDEIALEWTDDIRTRGYDVRGDLADLVPRHLDGPAPTDWTEDQLVDTSVAATAELLVEITRLRERVAGIPWNWARHLPGVLARRIRSRWLRRR